MIKLLVGLGAVVSITASSAQAGSVPSFKKEVHPILKRCCLECHGGPEAAAGVRFDSFQAMMSSRRRPVVPGQPEQSKLIMVLTGKARLMPPRAHTPRPSAKDVDKLKAWVKAGARDDSKASRALPVAFRLASVDRVQAPLWLQLNDLDERLRRESNEFR